MDDEKEWYESKSVWGSLVTLGATGAGIAGFVISPDMQAQIVNTMVLIATGIGGLVSLIGRIKAHKKIVKS